MDDPRRTDDQQPNAAPDWLLDDADLPPVEDLGLTDDGELTYRGEVVPRNDWRHVARRLKRAAAREIPENFASRSLTTRLRMAPHVRPREHRPRSRCQGRAGPSDDEGGDGGPPDGPHPPTVAELLSRLAPFIPADVLASVLLRRWTA